MIKNGEEQSSEFSQRYGEYLGSQSKLKSNCNDKGAEVDPYLKLLKSRKITVEILKTVLESKQIKVPTRWRKDDIVNEVTIILKISTSLSSNFSGFLRKFFSISSFCQSNSFFSLSFFPPFSDFHIIFFFHVIFYFIILFYQLFPSTFKICHILCHY